LTPRDFIGDRSPAASISAIGFMKKMLQIVIVVEADAFIVHDKPFSVIYHMSYIPNPALNRLQKLIVSGKAETRTDP
jgi:hypothetical protein